MPDEFLPFPFPKRPAGIQTRLESAILLAFYPLFRHFLAHAPVHTGVFQYISKSSSHGPFNYSASRKLNCTVYFLNFHPASVRRFIKLFVPRHLFACPSTILLENNRKIPAQKTRTGLLQTLARRATLAFLRVLFVFFFLFPFIFFPPPSCVRTYMSIYIIRFVNKFTHTHRISLGEIFDRGTLVAAVSKFVSFAIFLCNVRQVGISVDCGFLCGNSQSSEILKERNSIPRLLKG